MNVNHYFEKQVSITSLSICTFIPELNRILKRAGLTALGVIFLTVGAFSQVTIGDSAEPDKHAVLELKVAGDGRGLLLPGVKLGGLNATTPSFADTNVPQGLLVYNTGADASSPLLEGLYFWNGSRWEVTGNNWFYMPSTIFDTDFAVKPVGNEKNLYAAYAGQFGVASIPRSAGALELATQIPIFAPTDFYYYVVSYDTTVFTNIAIDANGLMTYDLLKDGDESTYINIVLVRKR